MVEAGAARFGFDTGTAGADALGGGDVVDVGGRGNSTSDKACTLPQKGGQVGSSAFECESRNMRMTVGTRSWRGPGFGNSGLKRSGHGSCMTVEGSDRMWDERYIGYLRLFLGHYGSVISITPHNGDSPFRVVGDYY